VLWAQA